MSSLCLALLSRTNAYQREKNVSLTFHVNMSPLTQHYDLLCCILHLSRNRTPLIYSSSWGRPVCHESRLPAGRLRAVGLYRRRVRPSRATGQRRVWTAVSRLSYKRAFKSTVMCGVRAMPVLCGLEWRQKTAELCPVYDSWRYRKL